MAVKLIVLGIFTTFIIACSSSQRLYEGSRRSETEIATLEIPETSNTSINGIQVVRNQVELLPGPHEVRIGFMIQFGNNLSYDRPIEGGRVYRSSVSTSGSTRAFCTLNLTAEAGTAYRLKTVKLKNRLHKSLGVIEVFSAVIEEIDPSFRVASCLSEPQIP